VREQSLVDDVEHEDSLTALCKLALVDNVNPALGSTHSLPSHSSSAQGGRAGVFRPRLRRDGRAQRTGRRRACALAGAGGRTATYRSQAVIVRPLRHARVLASRHPKLCGARYALALLTARARTRCAARPSRAHLSVPSFTAIVSYVCLPVRPRSYRGARRRRLLVRVRLVVSRRDHF
jgi:hypothetical protein